MITRNIKQSHRVKAWYYPPIFGDNTVANPNKLDWGVGVLINGRFIKKTTNGLEIVPGYNVTSKGEVFETIDILDFSDKGKIAFGRLDPGKDNASKILKDGIEDGYTNDANTIGNRFKNNRFVVKRITLG